MFEDIKKVVKIRNSKEHRLQCSYIDLHKVYEFKFIIRL
jgi:hypothetical protein